MIIFFTKKNNTKRKDNDTFEISENLKFRVFETPCHTKGSLLYLLNEKESTNNKNNKNKEDGNKHIGELFTGDTVFIGGCGRFFE